jgi:glycosyltransferase involved in cell wall biosynthesis
MSKRPDLLVDAAAMSGCDLAFVGACPPFLAEVIGHRARIRGCEDRVQVVGAVDNANWRHWIDQAALAVQLRDTASGETSAALLEALAAGLPVLTNVDSAEEYPAGTVSLLASPEPEEVAARIMSVAGSGSELEALSAAGQSFAEAHQFDRLAEALISIVTGDTSATVCI